MANSDWNVVNRRNRRSVFERLNPPHSQESNVDELAKLSLSVYVANFPSHLTVRELWNICGKMGTLVDVYIAKRKNHLGKMFAFCRYIKVSDSKTLIDSLSDVWIGKLRLHANVARFDMNVVSKPSRAGEKDSIDLQPKKPYLAGKPKIVADSARTIFLDDECIMERDLSCALMGKIKDINALSNLYVILTMGKIKDINALSNLYVILTNEGFGNAKLTYLGGFWVLIDVGSLSSKEKFLKHVGVASWFIELLSATNSFVSKGVLSDVDVANDSSLPFKRLCVVTKPHIIINDTIKVIIKGQAYWIRVKELEAWSPDFNNEFCEDSSSDDESVDEEVDHVSDTYDKGADFDKENEADFVLDSTGTNDKGADDLDKENKDDYVKISSDMNVNGAVLNNHCSSSKLKPNSEDPFAIYKLLNRNKNKQDSKSEDPIFPHGFTPNVVEDTYVENLEHIINQPNTSLSSNMEGTLRAKSGSNRSLQLKPGGSILDVMEGLVEVGKLWATTWKGTWTSSSTKLLIVSVYVPQDLSERKNLWEYISHMIDLWDGECVILGDFNEVRSEHERFGTMFNASGANAFNHFISSDGLVDLPLEAICLDIHLSDHRPILMRDLAVDYGPTSFRVFHSWFTKDGFDKLVEDSWKTSTFVEFNNISLLKKKFKALKKSTKYWCKADKQRSNASKYSIQSRISEIDKLMDKGKSNEDLVNERTLLLKDLQDINSRHSLDLIQKAKIRWAIEGDENSKYFHGIINKKRS
ncbi:RNA-directed DNA polymerase, eukaryota [Tanacetum coccineum]|uniref:RNA-directed DNA polymerase, eukaryota n=1 Tax=Tanacetum coccineum TaxID=301880 RepID=A0ABQ5CGK7_9ASTR